MRHLVLGLVMALLLVSNQAAGGGAAPVAYLSNTAGPTVLAVDTSSSTATPTSITVGTAGTTTFGVAVGPKGAKVYVTGMNGSLQGKLFVIDTTTKAVTPVTVGMYPRGVALSHDGSRVYVANALSNSVSVIDTATNTVVATVALPGFEIPFGVAFDAVHNRVHVTNFAGDNAVQVIDAASNQVVAGVPLLGGEPLGVAVSPDGTRLYVADYFSAPSGRVWVIDTGLIGGMASPVVATVTVGPNPFDIIATPDGKHVYVSNNGGNTISAINPAAVNAGAISITVGNTPQGVAVSSDGGTVFVANWGSGNLTAITVATNATRSISPPGVQFPVAFGNFVTPITAITVDIQVMPKVINLKSQGTIPVVIYGSKTFDVHTLDLSSLRLNGMAVQVKPNGELMANYGDFTGSGYDDVMVHFSHDGLQTASGDATVTLVGQTMCAPAPCTVTPIQGTTTVTFIH